MIRVAYGEVRGGAPARQGLVVTLVVSDNYSYQLERVTLLGLSHEREYLRHVARKWRNHARQLGLPLQLGAGVADLLAEGSAVPQGE